MSYIITSAIQIFRFVIQIWAPDWKKHISQKFSEIFSNKKVKCTPIYFQLTQLAQFSSTVKQNLQQLHSYVQYKE